MKHSDLKDKPLERRDLVVKWLKAVFSLGIILGVSAVENFTSTGKCKSRFFEVKGEKETEDFIDAVKKLS